MIDESRIWTPICWLPKLGCFASRPPHLMCRSIVFVCFSLLFDLCLECLFEEDKQSSTLNCNVPNPKIYLYLYIDTADFRYRYRHRCSYISLLDPEDLPLSFTDKLLENTVYLCNSLLNSHLFLSGAVIGPLSLSPSFQTPAHPFNTGVWIIALGPFHLCWCYFWSTQRTFSTPWMSVLVESPVLGM